MGRSRQVGDDEADARIKLAGMPLDRRAIMSRENCAPGAACSRLHDAAPAEWVCQPAGVSFLSGIRAETRQRLSEAVWGLGDQGSVAPIADPTRIRLWGSGHCFLQLLHVELEQAVSRPLGVAAHEVLGT
jgi:hypothetical protein